MARMILVLMIVMSAAAAVAAQPSASTWGGFTPRPTISFKCQPLPTLSGEGSQGWRLECWSGNIPEGSTAEGLFDWKADAGRGANADTSAMSMCSVPAATWNSRTAQRRGRPISSGCSGKFRALSPADGAADGVSAATFGRVPRPVMPTPTGLRVRLSCQRGSAGHSCSAFVRVLVQFSNHTLHKSINVFEKAARAMETRENWNAEIRSFVDTNGVLGVKGQTIDTEVCFPRADDGTQDGTYRPRVVGRKLLQQNQTLDMAPVYPYNETIIIKATRLARYASAIHGCQPSTPSSPQTYIAADGSTGRRQWGGPTGVSSWGGPGVNGQPGPECRSCFKDGVSFSDPPAGFQTPEFSVSNTNSFFDAVIVFTDSVISGVAGRNAVVVLFRATVTDTQKSQWLSNLGSCGLASDNRVAPSSNIASGAVCNGWNTPVEDLISLGLLQDVLRRLNALQASDRTVYVTGHSRGGALAAVFAAKLLALQAAGGLPAYSGDSVDQIKLYTFGSPRVGDTQFAAYLENNMMERYRYRDSSGNISPSPTLGCVLQNEAQLTQSQQACFISCNSVLTCSYGTTLAGSTTLIDHASYLGLDMNNDGCRADLAFLDAYTITPGTFFGYTCTPVTA
ncbi:hypothetical protein COO60DRAFT_1683903 [Scenedesmus sp. NREL 46B-D3]|nr:hypothetical protein COO60DRAFT_1683903 [Scenedesmus sp. NREL 46B-D3]